MVTYSSNFTRISFENENNFQFQEWLSTEGITEEQVKQEIMANANSVVENGAKVLLSDTRNFVFTISPELQEWIVANFFSKIIAAGLKKYAIILSEDLFSYVSIEQAVDENKDASVATCYFDTIAKAKEWLFN